ncbi:siderophore-interacting protein [Rhizobium sp. CSW-27]|uniref:siderophore-interacting protein n=1 Tax=Rhizobium sp. CSW-27 TaxID=2839985 RepID=UPI001C016A01|nr:siderophore-interacting protein [Rhizobium sp. CSW-27]MBT9370872.1 siderophore-interacting protein [Rhizobium sp. CSW-27]
MSLTAPFTLSGTAVPHDARQMLDQICEHFTEHANVSRVDDIVVMKNDSATAEIRLTGERLLIDLASPSDQALQMARIMLAEHMFYFAGDNPLDLQWSAPAPLGTIANLHHVTVTGAQDITPHMRRVRFSCTDPAPFLDGNMHVRVLIPPRDRQPVWPGIRDDGRISWPEGEDALVVRVYTIRKVDLQTGEVWIDFFQHPMPGVATPGADFARDARPGDRIALLGPGGGGRPEAQSLLLIGDETALPAILRILEELPAGATAEAIIEVMNADEEQAVCSHGDVSIRWIHRQTEGRTTALREAAKQAIAASPADRYIWIACEKDDVRALRPLLKGPEREKGRSYLAWYWER